MAKWTELLNPKKVESLLKPGAKPKRYADGGNLYLKIGRGTQRSWTFFYRWQGRWTEHGIGSARDVSLAAARKAAKLCRDQLQANVKPGSHAGTEPGTAPLFGTVADQVIEAKAAAWKGDGGRKRWTYQLSRRRGDDGKLDGSGYCQRLVNRPVDAITEQDVVGALAPIWMTKQRQAELTRQMIEAVLHAGGRRGADNPATLENIRHSLATQNAATVHCAAHPYRTAPEFMARLRAGNDTGARALEFLVLTWTRDREAREAQWREIDRANGVWIVAAERTKRNREHRVPITPRMLEILDEQGPADPDGYIFPSEAARGQPVSNKLFRNLMDRLGSDATIHGWRSCARDWAGETTAHPHDICEAALAHSRKDRTHAAYQRGDLLAKRRKLMEDWSRYLSGESAARRPLRRRRVLLGRRPALRIAA